MSCVLEAGLHDCQLTNSYHFLMFFFFKIFFSTILLDLCLICFPSTVDYKYSYERNICINDTDGVELLA
jgi:hypothetical protein